MFLKKFTIFSIFVLLLVLFCFNTVSAEDNITSNPINTSDSSNILTDSINEHNSNIGVEDEVNLTAASKNIKTELYPSTYSLLDKGLITTIKNQKETGLCWAFATLAALESHLLLINNETLTKNEYIREGIVSDFYDFSEADLAQIMSLNNTEGNGINRTNIDGGNFLYALAYLLNWYGPINETNPDNINSALKFWDYYPEHRIIEHHVQGIDIIPPRQNYTDNDKIKEAILKHGAIYTDMVALEEYINKNTTSIHKNYYNILNQ